MSDIKLKFYNSRTKQIDTFEHDINIPINIYTCGPTVYDKVHLGNLKTFMWSDFVVQLLNALGYKTKHIMNITDIDDKIINRLPEQTITSLIDYTNYYTDKFLADIHQLGLRNYTKDNIHKVTDNVDSMEEMVIELINKNFAYETPDGSVYFDSTKIINNPFYVDNDITDYESDRNIIKADGVKNQRDFVLWKVKTDRTIVWGNKLKKGCISWMPECTCLSLKYLDKVHIAMGGCDLRNLHHFSTISLAESLNPKQVYGDYWIHFGFLNFGGDKMSKSLGNVVRLDDVTYNFKLLRLYLLSKSYKNDVDYVEEEIETIKKDFINLHLLYNKLSNNFYRTNDKLTYLGDIYIYQKILAAVANNLDVRTGLHLLNDYINKIMKAYLTQNIANIILNELNMCNELFNILDKELLYIDDNTINLIIAREELRKQKKFDETDKIRKELNKNYIIEDDNSGFTLIKKL